MAGVKIHVDAVEYLLVTLSLEYCYKLISFVSCLRCVNYLDRHSFKVNTVPSSQWQQLLRVAFDPGSLRSVSGQFAACDLALLWCGCRPRCETPEKINFRQNGKAAEV